MKFYPSDRVKCLYTTLRNMRDTGTYFGFLPPHGRRLAAFEDITVPGDVMSYFKRQTENGRARRSFEDAIENGIIAIVSSPSVHFNDATLDETKVIALDNATFVAVDPCWSAASSSSISA